jgi:hypothetical protein
MNLTGLKFTTLGYQSLTRSDFADTVIPVLRTFGFGLDFFLQSLSALIFLGISWVFFDLSQPEPLLGCEHFGFFSDFMGRVECGISPVPVETHA